MKYMCLIFINETQYDRLIEARDLNAAIRVAAKMPCANLGSIEVRPIMEFNGA